MLKKILPNTVAFPYYIYSSYKDYSHVHVLLYDVKFNGEIDQGQLSLNRHGTIHFYLFFESKCLPINSFHLFFNFLCKNIFFSKE